MAQKLINIKDPTSLKDLRDSVVNVLEWESLSNQKALANIQAQVDALQPTSQPTAVVNPVTAGSDVTLRSLVSYSQTLTNQTSSIGTTNMVVAGGIAPAGIYRLSGQLNTTTAGTGGTVTLTFSWTGNGIARSIIVITTNLNTTSSSAFGYATVPIYSDGTAQITFSTTVAGATGSPKYALSVALERLS